MSLHDLVADPEPQPGAARALGGEKGVEYPGPVVGPDAGAVVGHSQHHSALSRGPVGRFSAAQQQAPATRRHGINRVADQVVEHLPDFSIEAGQRMPRQQPLLHLNMAIRDAPVVNEQCAFEKLIAADGACGAGLPVEVQSLAADAGNMAHLALRDLKIFAKLVDVGTMHGEIKKIGDGLQRIVDFVGD